LAFAQVQPGQTVVDLGSGPGHDLLLAARRVGPGGLVIGVDMTDAMIVEARRNAARAGLDNIEVRKGVIENLPVAAGSVDWVISNCVINLSPQKPSVFAEIARVLRPGGQFRISDIVVEELPQWLRESAAAYAACVAGAISEADYVRGLERAGLADVRVEHRLVYSAAQIRGLVGEDLERYGLDAGAIRGAFEEIEGKVWSAYFVGRRA
jgi:ubiquinone/menaquinone biosynthesis C-methylase UbiE